MGLRNIVVLSSWHLNDTDDRAFGKLILMLNDLLAGTQHGLDGFQRRRVLGRVEAPDEETAIRKAMRLARHY